MVVLLVVLGLTVAGCGSEGSDDSIGVDGTRDASAENPDRGNSGGAKAPSDDNNMDEGASEEEEIQFDYSEPVVSGESLFVANENLNSVAVIDSQSLSIETIPVGIEPTKVAAPEQSQDDSIDSVWVLNKGSSSVTLIDTNSLSTSTIPVAEGVNALKVGPEGGSAVTWFDSSNYNGDSADPIGDLSSVTVIKEQKTHRVAVGFNVRDVFYTDNGQRLLVLSDRGVSIIDVGEIESDSRADSVTLTPPSVETNTDDLEVQFTSNGRYAVTRVPGQKAVVLLDIEQREYAVVPFSTTPTDLDLI